jgi:hypothetical protein
LVVETLEETPDTDRIATSVQEVLLRRGPDGERLYSRNEIRDFAVALMVQLDVEFPDEMKVLMIELCAEIGVDPDEGTAAVAPALGKYFKKNPLNKDLVDMLNQLGAGEVMAEREGYKEDDGGTKDAATAAGGDATLRAPITEDEKPDVTGKLKKGLS